eukprot:GILJ01008143.1.p3 GENE.GILJ01008143.1~~GILJ01008143.1.p3  ORF type:complete len:119 (+),score=4.50 GILJ01008143.1:373-729(+)
MTCVSVGLSRLLVVLGGCSPVPCPILPVCGLSSSPSPVLNLQLLLTSSLVILQLFSALSSRVAGARLLCGVPASLLRYTRSATSGKVLMHHSTCRCYSFHFCPNLHRSLVPTSAPMVA